MDVYALIRAVQKRPAIWDKRQRLNTNRTYVDNCWKEIASEMKCREMNVRKKWKYLRDNFCVEYSKRVDDVPASGLGPNNCYRSKWVYFHQLLFLKDIVTPRASSLRQQSGPTPPVADFFHPELEVGVEDHEMSRESYCGEMKTFLCESQSQEDQPVETEHQQLPAEPPAKKRKHAVDYYKQVLDIENKKLQYFLNKQKKAEVKEDCDLMFYKSLLPHIKQIPLHMKLVFQRQIQDVVEQFAYGVSDESPCSPSRATEYQISSPGASPSPSHSQPPGSPGDK